MKHWDEWKFFMFKTIRSKVVYKNKWMSVREDDIARPSGEKGIYGVVDKPDCAVILAVDEGRIHLVQQYRYTVQQRCWEFPQGAWESNPDADHLALAKGELKEETGLKAESMIYLGQQYIAYGFLNQTCHIYYASQLSYVGNCLVCGRRGFNYAFFRITRIRANDNKR